MRGGGSAAVSMKLIARCLLPLLPLATVIACRTPPSPAVRAFGDNRFWITLDDMRYTVGTTDKVIVVPQGFVTDFASIPQFLWSFGLSPNGQYSRAAIVHDYLYWTQGCTRDEADRLLFIAMAESNVKPMTRYAVYGGVSIAGKGPWDGNAKERQEGLLRIVPKDYLSPSDPNVSWPAYRDMLVRDGVKDPTFDQHPSYCRLGDTLAVP